MSVFGLEKIMDGAVYASSIGWTDGYAKFFRNPNPGYLYWEVWVGEECLGDARTLRDARAMSNAHRARKESGDGMLS